MRALAMVGVLLGLALVVRALFWGGPWLVVRETTSGLKSCWPCWTRWGAEFKRDECLRRETSGFYAYSIERRNWF